MSLPDVPTAYRQLMNDVRGRVIFHKLATVYGIQPQTQPQADRLLKMAGQARLLHQAKMTKAASSKTDPLFAAEQALHNELVRYGAAGPVKVAAEQAETASIKAAAFDLMQDPVIYNSALALKAAEAEAFKQTHGVAA